MKTLFHGILTLQFPFEDRTSSQLKRFEERKMELFLLRALLDKLSSRSVVWGSSEVTSLHFSL
jgi:hypothetical protein